MKRKNHGDGPEHSPTPPHDSIAAEPADSSRGAVEARLTTTDETSGPFARAVGTTASWLDESPPELRRIFYAWITRVLASVDTDLPLDEIDDLGELSDMMEERIANWKHQWTAEALEEGREQGRAQGRRLGEAEILKRQLELKFRDVPEEYVSRVDAADDPDLLRWADRILTADSLDEVFAD